MSRLLSSIIILAALIISAPAAAQQKLARFEVANAVFSPDGDADEDTTNVNFTLGVAALSVTAIVFQADSITPVDTLLAGEARPTGRTDLGWDGRNWTGALVADAGYVVGLEISTAEGDTTAARIVIVDTGAPAIQINAVTPNPFGPGAPGAPSELSFSFTVTGTSPIYPGIPADEVQWEFRGPSGNAVVADSVRTVPPYAGSAGTYELRWWFGNQTGLNDGQHLVTMTVVDQAGHASAFDHTFVLDTKAPDLKFVSPVSGQSFRDAPAELRATVRDFSVIDTLAIRYSENGPYLPVTVDRKSGDTTFFHAPLADSLVSEGQYSITLRAVDAVRRSNTATATYTIDRTAPAAPELDPFDGVWHTAEYRVTGTFPSGSTGGSRVRIYRNGAVVDSVFTLSIKEINRVIALEPGLNVVSATFVDGALNESPPSNELRIRFDDGSGLFVAAPMRPGDHFDVNLSSSGVQVVVRLYDLAGDLVAVLEDFENKQNYSLTWDGRNGSGDLVKRGPLLAVATAILTSGDKTTYRELFLFTPDAE